ncbi:hypothetical protein, partial [Rhodopseudomonas sp. WA056]|uniref:hypothetical protein n=1 Tax=Rhodopseudomonas sp. WA056 TaxID=2269367 RepID=UPI0019672BFF
MQSNMKKTWTVPSVVDGRKSVAAGVVPGQPTKKGPGDAGALRLLTKSSPLAGTFDSMGDASQTLTATDFDRDGQSRRSGSEG